MREHAVSAALLQHLVDDESVVHYTTFVHESCLVLAHELSQI